MKRVLFSFLILALFTSSYVQAADLKVNPEAKSFKYSTTVEKERPQLDDVTRGLISAYQKNPTEANKQALRNQIAINYDKVVAKKKAKLEELKQTAKDKSKIDEMQVIVDEMIRDRESRIDQSLSRFTDSRLKPGIRETKDGYLPVLGAAQNVSVAYTPVTNAEYAKFVSATGRKAPKNWINGIMPANLAKYPVVNVSYNDAVAYCNWLSNNDSSATYRLPTEKEWEQAAGHMPKDADFNAGENKGLTPVNAYSKTISASGAVDMWGNVWEWTSTARTNGKAVKGGAYDSKRTDCRTEDRTQSRNPDTTYENVGFRVFREK
ncbi:MAG: formylglycine-generating enzyme family protein [Candidatus Gastranaerophilales bacterium]|nr:formylglycine-generating enzyme family protein [Candidatus Gastranaerophilales bacterium]